MKDVIKVGTELISKDHHNSASLAQGVSHNITHLENFPIQ